MQEFKGKVAVVTGAASRMGRGLAERFAREGMKVVLADVEEPALNNGGGGTPGTGVRGDRSIDRCLAVGTGRSVV